MNMEPETKFTNSARYKCLEYLKKSTVDLSLSYCGIEECDPGHFYGPTSRTEYLLHYIIDGKGTYQVNNKTYQMEQHQLFLICPGVTSYYVADMEEPWKYLWVAFSGIKAKTYLDWANLDENHLICQFNEPNVLIKYIQGILNARELTYANELKREGNLLLFLSALIKSQHGTGLAGAVHDYPYQVYVNHAVEFIEHNYQKGIRVNDIANYIGINRSYLTNIFRKSLNKSVQEYLVNYRLDKAATLLRTTNMPVGDIAKEVGYEDSLAFSKIFKHFKNSSPTVYRTSKENIENSSQRIENNLLDAK
jgi:AraC family transcriptional regulator of arabinose operon